jgi:phage antirepressor YoqD-like protein
MENTVYKTTKQLIEAKLKRNRLVKNIIEVWKPIKDSYYYSVSNLARFRNNYGKIYISKKTDTHGYSIISIETNLKEQKTFKVHKLVYGAFYNNELTIHHVDGDRSNNKLSNLIGLTLNQHRAIHGALNEEGLMTIKQIALALGVSVELITKAVRNLYPDKMMKGVTTILNEVEATEIKKYVMSNRHLVRPCEVTTDLEKQETIMKAISYLTESINTLKSQNEKQSQQLIEAQPKLETYNNFIENSRYQSMGTVANIFGIGRNKLFKRLRELGILQSNKSNWNMPYQTHISAGYFVVKEFVTDNVVKAQTFVTPKGLVYISKIIGGVE